MNFDTVSLSPLTGRLLMSRLPGADENTVESFRAALGESKADAVVCLVPREEINKKSPSYMSALVSKAFPVPVIEHGIHDYAIPEDLAAFSKLVFEVKTGLQGGKKYWVHCAGGHGRTGLFVGCVLRSLGYSGYEALDLTAPRGPETRAQMSFLDAFQPLTALPEKAKPVSKKAAPAKGKPVKAKAPVKKSPAKKTATKVVAKKSKSVPKKKVPVKQVIAHAKVVEGKAAKSMTAPKKKAASAKAKKSLPKKKIAAKKVATKKGIAKKAVAKKVVSKKKILAKKKPVAKKKVAAKKGGKTTRR